MLSVILGLSLQFRPSMTLRATRIYRIIPPLHLKTNISYIVHSRSHIFLYMYIGNLKRIIMCENFLCVTGLEDLATEGHHHLTTDSEDHHQAWDVDHSLTSEGALLWEALHPHTGCQEECHLLILICRGHRQVYCHHHLTCHQICKG